MKFDFEVYEKERDAIREINELHLAGFEKCLRNSGLSERTIEKHVSNMDFYNRFNARVSPLQTHTAAL